MKNKGFSLVELLLVVAIIVALTGIAIPVFSNIKQVQNRSDDISMMRLAYSRGITYWAANDYREEVIYYFDGWNVVDSSEGITSYGKYTKDIRPYATSLFCNVSSSIPARGGYIIMRITPEGRMTMGWGEGYPIIDTLDYWQSTTTEERLNADREFIYHLQDVIRSMTYREIMEMFGDHNHPTDQVLKVESGWGHSCYTLAVSYFNNTTGEIDDSINHIYATQLFERAGYNLDAAAPYLVSFWTQNNSRDPLYIKVDVGKMVKNLSETNLNKKATGAIVYLNGSGYKTSNGPDFGHNR